MTSAVGKNNKGFSLFELILVLVLLGVGLASVLPNMNRGLQDREVRQTALGLAAAARELRSRALMDGRPQRLMLDLSRNRYVAARAGEVQLPSETIFVSVSGGESCPGSGKETSARGSIARALIYLSSRSAASWACSRLSPTAQKQLPI